jgi:hypothetical protein
MGQLHALGPMGWILPDNGDRLQCTKLYFMFQIGAMDNVQEVCHCDDTPSSKTFRFEKKKTFSWQFFIFSYLHLNYVREHRPYINFSRNVKSHVKLRFLDIL